MKAQEHRALGNDGTGGARVDLSGDGPGDRLVLGFGDVVALSGDFFVPDGSPARAPRGGAGEHADALASDGLFALAAIPGDRGGRAGTRDEIVGALKVMAADQGEVDPRFEPGGEFAHFTFSTTAAESEVERRIRDRFLALGSSNDDHFVDPGPRGPATAGDRPPARFGSAVQAYHHLHERALDEAWRLAREGGDPSRAMAREAAAQHYLTDAFAAGHLRTPVAAMREFWQARYPRFWEGLRNKVARDTATALRELALPVRLLPSRFVLGHTSAAVEDRTRGYPRLSLGDLLAKVFHDWDNLHGLALVGGGMVFGDGCLDRGLTRELAVAAVRAGVDDVEVAFGLGAKGTPVSSEHLSRAVREATGARGDAFLAETMVPTPSAENPSQNWRAADLDELWSSPLVGSSGPTVGAAVSEALQPGGELTRRLASLGQGVAGSLSVPAVPGLRRWLGRRAGQAYQRGFVDNLTADPKRAVSACVAEFDRDLSVSIA